MVLSRSTLPTKISTEGVLSPDSFRQDPPQFLPDTRWQLAILIKIDIPQLIPPNLNVRMTYFVNDGMGSDVLYKLITNMDPAPVNVGGHSRCAELDRLILALARNIGAHNVLTRRLAFIRLTC